jgi:RNA-directed DNA polymerase
MLDEVDKELERRGYSFARYANDCNVYVRSCKSGERVMALLKRLYAKLHLMVIESKSAVVSAYGRKFLGYSFWATKGKAVKLRVADKAYKQLVRQLTRRIGGKGMAEVAQKLKQYVNGWKANFKLADTPKVRRELDKWMRHWLRAIQLKQWKRGSTIYRE